MTLMTTAQIILSIVYFVVALALIGIVMLQSGKSSGLSSVFGGADTFLARNKAKTFDARLARLTKWVAIVFMVLTLVICLL